MYVSLPSYWHDAAAYVNADPSSGPALILPPNDFYERSYAWGYGGVDIIPASVFTRPTLIPGPSLDYLDDPRNMSLTSVMAAYAKEDPPRLLAAARNLGITFIICRNDVTSSQRDCGLNEKAQGLQIRRFGDLLVARLSNQQPAFPAWNGWVDGTYDGLTPGNLLGLGIITKLLPRFNADPRVATAAPHDLVSVESSRTQVINTMIAFVASGSSRAHKREILAKVPFSVAATFSSSLTPLASLDGFVPRGHVVLSGLIQPAFTAIDRAPHGSLLRIYNPSFETLAARLVAPPQSRINIAPKTLSLVAGRTDVALPDIPIADARTLQIELTAQLPTKISTSDTSTVLLGKSLRHNLNPHRHRAGGSIRADNKHPGG